MTTAVVWKDGRTRKPLPIDPDLIRVRKALKTKKLVILVGPPGSGKTSRVAQYLALHYKKKRIWVTQPSRAAVFFNSRYVSGEMGCALGERVGYSIVKDRKYAGKTQILYTVDSGLLRRICESKGSLPPGILVIDESHIQNPAQAILFGLIKKKLNDSPRTKVIISSATCDVPKVRAYFGGAPLVTVVGEMFPVEDELFPPLPDETFLHATVRAAREVINRFIAGKLLVPTNDGSASEPVTEGVVAVLLPGKGEIRRAMHLIQGHINSLGLETRTSLFQCHAESENWDHMDKPLQSGELRILFGTDVLRTAVTVPHLVWVIDSCRVKRSTADQYGIPHLRPVLIALSERDQTRGRLGRLRTGVYMLVCTPQELETLLPFAVPPIQGAPLGSVVLQVASVDESVRTFPFMDPPCLEHVDATVLTLQRIGALDKDEGITKLGRALAKYPIDPRRAFAFRGARELDVLPEMIIAAAAMEAGDPFETSTRVSDRQVVGAATAELLLRHRAEGASWQMFTPLALGPGDEAPEFASLDDVPWLEGTPEGCYQVNCSHPAFPSKTQKGNWIVALLRHAFSRGTKSDLVAIVTLYREYHRALRAVREKLEQYYRRGSEAELKRKITAGIEREMTAWCGRVFVSYRRMQRIIDVVDQILGEIRAAGKSYRENPARVRDYNPDSLSKAAMLAAIEHIAVQDRRTRYESASGPLQLHWQSCALGARIVVAPSPFKSGSTQDLPYSSLNAVVRPEWLWEIFPDLCTRTVLPETLGLNVDTDCVTAIVEERFLGTLFRKVDQAISEEPLILRGLAQWLVSLTVERPSVRGKRLDALGAVLIKNAKRQVVAADLVRVAGLTDIPVANGAQLLEFYLSKLGAARTFAELCAAANDFLVPPLAPALYEVLERDYPLSILVGGVTFAVDYSSGKERARPTITINFTTERAAFDALPQPELKLPGGAVVYLRITGLNKGATIEGSNTINLRKKVLRHQGSESGPTSTAEALPEPPQPQS